MLGYMNVEGSFMSASSLDKIVREFSTIINMFKMFSVILREIADIEESEGKRIDEILKESLSPTRLAELSKKMPPDIYTELIASLLKLASIMSMITNPMMLPANEKKKLVSEIEEIANSLENVVNKLKGC
jgi:hypothetical protein